MVASSSHAPRLPFLFAVSVAAGLAACGGAGENLPPPPPPPPPAPSSLTTPPAPAATTASAPATSATPAAAAPVLVPGVASPDPAAPLPTVKFLAPTAGQLVAKDKAGDFQVKLDVKNWATATGSAHVHLILDNTPYKPLYDTKQPVKLSELPGGGDLAEGQHVLVAFPSRANHESVKTAGAFSVVSFYVGKKAQDAVDVKKPMLVYSRPKGDYKGETANHVLVDFQLANVTLAEGKDHVHVTVTGPGIEKELSAHVEKFGAPLYLDNLQNGTYTVKTELVGADNKVLAGPWNATTREIKVDHEAPMDDPHGGHGAAPAPASSAAPAASATPAKPATQAKPATPAAPAAPKAAPKK